MSETKWTPGPWVVRQTVIYGKEYGGRWVEPEDAHQLVLSTGSGGAQSYTRRIVDRQDHDDNEANAHLIAAAPELYEWLDACLGLVDGRGPPNWDGIRAILAKARGETP